jgi:hypothetical protein
MSIVNAIVSEDCELLLKYNCITGYAGKHNRIFVKMYNTNKNIFADDSLSFMDVITNSKGQYILALDSYKCSGLKGKYISIESIENGSRKILREIFEYNNRIEIVNVTVLSTIRCIMIERLNRLENVENIKAIIEKVDKILNKSFFKDDLCEHTINEINILCEMIILDNICKDMNTILCCFAETILENVDKCDFGNKLIIEKIFEKCCNVCNYDKLKKKIREKSRKACIIILLNRKLKFSLLAVTKSLFNDYCFNFTEKDIHEKISQHN